VLRELAFGVRRDALVHLDEQPHRREAVVVDERHAAIVPDV
jgi:hypothetical protein